jgi:hypothetical protein
MNIDKAIIVRYFVIFFSVYVCSNCNALAQHEVNVEIRTDDVIGKIRALNGGTLSPVCNLKLLDLSREFKELQIPLVRLHDAPYVNDNVVDIHTIFRDFRLDPMDESNYDFRKTDDYIASILKTGTKIIFRLGESIEHTKKNYYAFKAFAELLKTPVRIKTNYNASDSIVVCSGINNDRDRLTILTSNFSEQDKKLNFNLPDDLINDPLEVKVYCIDQSHELELINNYKVQQKFSKFSENLPSESVLLIVCEDK